MREDFKKIKQIIAKSTDNPEILECLNEWIFTETDLKFGQSPHPKILADEIRRNTDPMPELIREFLARLVEKHVPYNPIDPNAKDLTSHQRASLRRHEARVQHMLIKSGSLDKTVNVLKEELAKKYNVDPRTIDRDLYINKDKKK